MDYLRKISIIAIFIMSVVVFGCGNGSDDNISSNGSGSVLTDTHTKMSFDFSQALCARCHTHDGARAYIGLVNGLESPNEIYDLLMKEDDIPNPSPVQCQTCHDLDNKIFLGDQAAGLPSTWSSQFKTCTACHQLLDYNGSVNVAFHEVWGDVWSKERIITDTHYDDPLTTDIEGYIINTSSTHSSTPGNMNDGTCIDCHDQHNIDLMINRQWANSAHGGHIGEDGLVEEADGPAWVHYDFKGTNRQACQRCHTATGFRNFANNPATYDPVNNFFTASGEQRELLYCWACHTDNNGDLRDPGLFNATSPYAEPAQRIDEVPNINGSNICMPCHSGRNSGTDGIANSTDDFSDKSFVNSHYLAAGGVLYRTSGYEFSNIVGGPLDYNDPSYYAHNTIGTSGCSTHGVPCPDDMLGGGPCVGCHMLDSDSGHTLRVVEKDINNIIIGLQANDEVCSFCHKDYTPEPPFDVSLTPAIVEHESEGFDNALVALKDALAAKGFDYLGGHPYFGNTDWTAGTLDNSVGKNNMGAAFNFNLLHHEPGAFAHNRYYTWRLIFDSIDWLDNNVMDGTIDLSAFPVAAEWFQHDGDTSNDNAITRP